jgi:hypothetical protein
MSIGGVYYINVQQHWSPGMTSWCLLEVCTTSMCSNIDHLQWDRDFYWRVRTTTMCSNTDHLEWYLDVYWRCVLRQCAATLITLNDILMSTGGMCTTSMCSNTDDVEWHIDVYWRVRTATMCSNTDHLEWYLDVYWRVRTTTMCSNTDHLEWYFDVIGGVYYVNVQQHWSPWMTSWCLMEVCTTSISSNTDHFEWDLDVYWRCVLRQCAATLITLNDILMSIKGVYCVNVQQH